MISKIRTRKGFTLIEVVVVMAIIAVLAVLVTGAIGIARRMVRDTTRRTDIRTLNTALIAFYTKNHRMPQNYHPGYGACEGEAGDYFEKSMQEIVDAGVLKEIPKSPSNTPSGDYRKYCYYDYGTFTTGNPPKRPGAILVTRLEGGSNGEQDGSCRPWGAPAGGYDAGGYTGNWCNIQSEDFYCICDEY